MNLGQFCGHWQVSVGIISASEHGSLQGYCPKCHHMVMPCLRAYVGGWGGRIYNPGLLEPPDMKQKKPTEKKQVVE